MDGVDRPGEVQHGIDHMDAASGHSPGRYFLTVLPPVLAAEPIGTRPAEISLDVEKLAEGTVREHAADLLQRRLEAPVVADGKRHLVVGAGLNRRGGVRERQAE